MMTLAETAAFCRELLEAERLERRPRKVRTVVHAMQDGADDWRYWRVDVYTNGLGKIRRMWSGPLDRRMWHEGQLRPGYMIGAPIGATWTAPPLRSRSTHFDAMQTALNRGARARGQRVDEEGYER